MSNNLNLNRQIQRLRDANVALRRDLERAELQVPQLNAAIRQLARLDFGHDKIYLGDVIHHSGYGANSATPDEGLIVQAALSRAQGIGALIWGVEDHCAFYRSPLPNLGSLASKFLVFEDMPPAFRALLAARVKPLVDQFCSEMLPR